MWKVAARKVKQYRVFGWGRALPSSRLRQIAPYILVELLLPGGTLVALCMYAYRRKRSALRVIAV